MRALLALILFVLAGCDQPTKKLPFIGKRYFETRPGVSGTGTPHKKVEIKENGEVIFSFSQINQADKTETTGKYHAGQFKKIVKCVFEEWDNDTSYYEITKDKIYETDSAGNRLMLDECCGLSADVPVCSCEDEYDDSQYW
ncbi:MAG TPA: hypothetical protein VEB40_14325 [Flavipsychrobacter sp.]|nr:hypothetical protein [Flavipsychrobacter sp.]